MREPNVAVLPCNRESYDCMTAMLVLHSSTLLYTQMRKFIRKMDQGARVLSISLQTGQTVIYATSGPVDETSTRRRCPLGGLSRPAGQSCHLFVPSTSVRSHLID
eukprot:scaffold2943_cov379-Prasinococcus_capsulatus_cf.AAC.2